MRTKSQSKAILWSQPNCAGCNSAKALLEKHGIPYEVKMLGGNATKAELLEAVPGARSVPQIFLDGQYVGGLDKLQAQLKNISGGLELK